MIRKYATQAADVIKQKWEPKDVIALVALVACTALLLSGKNHEITWCFCGIIAAYVGVDIIVTRRK